jgi:uncharacterized membrane protein YbhN (UPF0104 family)
MKLGEEITVDKQCENSVLVLHEYDSPRTSAKNTNQAPRKISFLRPAVSAGLLAGVIALLAFNYDLSAFLADLHQLSFWTIAIIFTALLANVVAATLRFKTIAADVGHSISFRSAMATVSTSNLAGAIFFQLAGQLIARGVFLGRAGIPFANVIVITAYERILSAVLSALLGLAGAYYIFGVVYLDQRTGGVELIKISCGLIAATILGALLGYGRSAARSIAPLLTRHFTQRSLRVIALTLLVQLPTMIAYVAASSALSTEIALPNLVAASAVVMFAASVPISFAGWGVREMSAVAALGAIGVAGHAAFTTAVLVGIGSLLAMAVTAILSLPASANTKKREVKLPARNPIDYSRALSWFLPLAAATLVLFQIYIPLGSGLVNVNLADPIALVGGALFLLNAIKKRTMPKWRVRHINAAVIAATFVLSLALLIGVSRFGWTTWAWFNRYLGWLVLLSYGAISATVVSENGKDGLRTVLLTFVGATAAVAGIEVTLVLLREVGTQFVSQLLPHGQIEGFAQNRNSFALQLVIATATIIVFIRGAYMRIGLLALMFLALWFAGSRSGWIASIFLLGTSFYVGATNWREILTTIASASIVVLLITAAHALSIPAPDLPAYGAQTSVTIPPIVPDESSTLERMVTIYGGFKLFFEHPLLGAGLGAFRNQLILAADGLPLVIHSTPLWLLAELGVVGFLAFAIPGLSVFVTEWRRARKDQTAALIVLCLVAFAVMGAPADMLYQRTFWLVIGAALAATPAISHARSSR